MTQLGQVHASGKRMKTRKQQPGPAKVKILFTQLGPGQDSIVSLENIGFIFYQNLRLLHTFSYIGFFFFNYLTP